MRLVGPRLLCPQSGSLRLLRRPGQGSRAVTGSRREQRPPERHCRFCSFQGHGHLCQGSLSQPCLPWLGGVPFYKEPLKSSPSDYSILGKQKPRGLRGEQPEGWIHPRVVQATSIY